MGVAHIQHDRQQTAERLRTAALRRRGRLHGADADRPALRLAATGRKRSTPRHGVAGGETAPRGQRIADALDPRWTLAVRVAASLQGAILPPEKRDRLVALGRSMGLSPFDANLVIAIVQDQARRGVLADYCPQAAAAQLAMVPAPRRHRPVDWLRWPHAKNTVLAAASLLGLQALAVWYFLG